MPDKKEKEQYFVHCLCGEKQCRETPLAFDSLEDAMDHCQNRLEFPKEIRNHKGELKMVYDECHLIWTVKT